MSNIKRAEAIAVLSVGMAAGNCRRDRARPFARDIACRHLLRRYMAAAARRRNDNDGKRWPKACLQMLRAQAMHILRAAM